MKSEALADIVSEFGVDSTPCENPLEGTEKAFSVISDYDVLVVCGSLYLAGDVREKLINLCDENRIK